MGDSEERGRSPIRPKQGGLVSRSSQALATRHLEGLVVAVEQEAALSQQLEDIFHAALYGDADTLVKIVKESPKLMERTDPYGLRPIHYAAFGCQEEAIRILAQAGSPLDCEDVWGNTALFYSARAGGAESYQLLVDSGANPRHKNSRGRSPRDRTLEYLKVPLPQPLFEFHDWKLEESQMSLFPPHYEVSWPGCDPYSVFVACENDPPESWKCEKSEIKADVFGVTRALVEFHWNVNSRWSKSGDTMMHEWASRHWEWPWPAAYLLLLNAGADVNARNKNAETPLSILLRTWWSRERPLRYPPPELWTDLRRCVRILLEHGADPNARGGLYRQTPLGHALQIGQVREESRALLELLLTHGADPNLWDGDEACIALAMLTLEPDSVEVLLSHGADPDARVDENGNRPLHHAVLSRGNWDFIDILLSHGADVNALNARGEKASDVAASLGDDRLAAYLRQRERGS